MDISKVQKQLEAEHKALDQKYKFITELTALMKKHNQSSESLLEILSEGSSAPAKRGRKPGRPSKKAAAAAPAKKKAKARKKSPARPLRKFKNPKTGEVAQSRAPQVDKTIKSWAADLKMDWRKLEI
ncbi:hypothetical protein I6N98_03540 [Spongiibacter nanhainus]|uniref:H-NS histone family protein n=1 Tax=Spongiibacter nanhainus TaxID=2794344 RepID=A0A7T4R1X1_9GAMM|nr:hypothetical protein [Spongiibacter nanhainus]QQD18946.1 hypothetical protein I6N98_03540 [Spongiibacter nanhainus]